MRAALALMRKLRSPFIVSVSLALPVTLAACTSNPPPPDAAIDTALSFDAPPDAPAEMCFDDMSTTETLAIPGLGALEVVYDGRGMPHIYGTTIHDVGWRRRS